jgi:hypothetical protein
MRLVVVGQLPVGAFPDGDVDGAGFAFVAQVGEGGQVRCGQGDDGQDGMVAQAGGVVFAAGAHIGGP